MDVMCEELTKKEYKTEITDELLQEIDDFVYEYGYSKRATRNFTNYIGVIIETLRDPVIDLRYMWGGRVQGILWWRFRSMDDVVSTVLRELKHARDQRRH